MTTALGAGLLPVRCRARASRDGRLRSVGRGRLLTLLVSTVAFLLGCGRGVAPGSAGTTEAARQPRSAVAFKLGEVLVSDDFDDPQAARLSVRTDQAGIYQGYVGGEYVLRLSPSYQSTAWLVGPPGSFANVHVAVDARLAGGTEARWVGVVCRLNVRAGRASSYYVLAVLPATGRFALERHDPDGRKAELVPLQSSAAVRRGNMPNHLELTCAGSTIAATINGTEVGLTQDGTYDSGPVAVIAGRSGSIPTEARFDNLVVREASGEP